MAEDAITTTGIARHGATRLPSVEVDSFNIELKDDDGSIEKGAQNLPGDWESSKFNLPASLVEAIPEIGDHDTAVLMHNDGVAQGLLRSHSYRTSSAGAC
jgi:hypothetical protein